MPCQCTFDLYSHIVTLAFSGLELIDPFLAQVCRSFGNAPETSTHPSGASRCASLDQCFANVTVAQERRTKAVGAKAYSAGPKTGSPADFGA